MSASQIDDLINPAPLRLGIKRAFTGDIHEILSELFGNSQRAGARNAQITTDDRGFIYQDDGRGLRDKSAFEALLKLGESGWDQSVEEEQQPMGLGIHSLLWEEAQTLAGVDWNKYGRLLEDFAERVGERGVPVILYGLGQ